MTRRSTSPRSAGAAARHDGSRSGCSTWTAGSSSPGSRRPLVAGELDGAPGLDRSPQAQGAARRPAGTGHRSDRPGDPSLGPRASASHSATTSRRLGPRSRRPRGPRRSRTNGRGHIRARVAASVASSGAKRRRKVKAVESARGLGDARTRNGVLHRWDRALRDPPEAQNRLARGLEEVMTASEKLDVAGAVGEIGEGVDRGPHREVDDLEVVLRTV